MVFYACLTRAPAHAARCRCCARCAAAYTLPRCCLYLHAYHRGTSHAPRTLPRTLRRYTACLVAPSHNKPHLPSGWEARRCGTATMRSGHRRARRRHHVVRDNLGRRTPRTCRHGRFPYQAPLRLHFSHQCLHSSPPHRRRKDVKRCGASGRYGNMTALRPHLHTGLHHSGRIASQMDRRAHHGTL